MLASSEDRLLSSDCGRQLFTWQDHCVVHYEASEQKCQRLVYKISIGKSGPE